MSKPDPLKKPSTADSQQSSRPYSAGDPIPVADVTELDTDTAWGLFEDVAEQKVKRNLAPDPFAETVPADLEPRGGDPKSRPPRKQPG
jgi:hypothetical protein